MKSDRFIYAPGGLALGKGLVYLLAFSNTVLFINATNQTYYFGLFVYCCGCICDYIESSLPSSRKCRAVRNVSLIATIVIGVVTVADLALLSAFERAQEITNFITTYQFWFTLPFAILWLVPLISGTFQCLSFKEKKSDLRPPGKSLWGYNLITQDS